MLAGSGEGVGLPLGLDLQGLRRSQRSTPLCQEMTQFSPQHRQVRIEVKETSMVYEEY